MRILRRLDAYALDHTGSRGVVDGAHIQPLSSSSWRLHSAQSAASEVGASPLQTGADLTAAAPAYDGPSAPRYTSPRSIRQH
ncbi:hypothetical protein GOODEAATRI_023877 [Goodea atripinnis]|uniref:Uncharacterized protein n=1 Tax=Goodea atripinnis TaxID=208336 RepID=A0ABV0MW55_9TELE